MHLPSSLNLLVCVCVVQAKCQYSLTKTYNTTNFFDQFNFRSSAEYTNGDPTDGSVNYLGKADALKSGLAQYKNGQVYLGVDNKNVATRIRKDSSTLHARDSLRLEAKSTFSSGIMVADLEHMPGTACGVWPSLWFYNYDEDPVGEIDLIEGINRQDANVVSLHTCGTCTFSNIGGTEQRSTCNNGGTLSRQCEDGDNYDGCGNTMSKGSYGTAFNNGKGGYFATVLAAGSLKLYWWPRGSQPKDVGTNTLRPDTWGTPASTFTGGSNCNISKYFKKLTLTINTDFCGDNINQEIWDQECKAYTRVATCDKYVSEHPAAFAQTYWLINSIKQYN